MIARAALATFLGIFLVGFLVIAFRPMVRPNAVLVTIGPKLETDLSESVQVANQSIQSIWNATEPLHSIEAASPLVLGDAQHVNQFVANHTRRGPRLIYLAGVASPVAGKAMLVSGQSGGATGQSRDAMGQSLDVGEVIQSCAKSMQPSVIVVDAVQSRRLKVGETPELTALEFVRSVSESIEQQGQAPIAVVVCQSEPEQQRSQATGTRCSETLVAALGKAADNKLPATDKDGDGVVTGGEMIDKLTALPRRRAYAGIPRLLSNRPPNYWHGVSLWPVHSIDSSSTETAQSIAEVGAKPTDEESNADSAPQQADELLQVEVTAPTLALAIKLRKLGYDTRRSEECQAITDQLRVFLDDDAVEADVIKWLAEPKIADARWDELVWMRFVCGQSHSWPLKQSLIQCRVLANRVAVETSKHKFLAQRVGKAQWMRLDAERSLASPVRGNHLEYAAGSVSDALARFRLILDDAMVIQQAERIVERDRRRAEELLSMPVRAKSPRYDYVCQRLADVVGLQTCLNRDHEDMIRDCRLLVESIQRRSDMRQTEVARTVRTATDSAPQGSDVDSNFQLFETTQIRVARSALVTELLTGNKIGAVEKKSCEATRCLAHPEAHFDQVASAVVDFRSAIGQAMRHRGRMVARSNQQRALDKLRRIALDAQRYSVDATRTQRDLQIGNARRAIRIAAKLDETIIANLSSGPEIDVQLHGSLARTDNAWLDVTVRHQTQTPAPGWIEIEYDSAVVAVAPITAPAVRASRIGEARYQTVIQQSRQNVDPNHASDDRLQQVRIDLQRIGGAYESAAINVRWVTKENVYRRSVPLELPLPQLATVALGMIGENAGDTQVWRMRANDDRFQTLNLRATDDSSDTLAVRLLAWKTPGMKPPSTLSSRAANEWLSQVAPPVELAKQESVFVKAGEYVPVRFKPHKLKPAAEPITVGTLLCEVTDPVAKRVQYIDLGPAVVRPSAVITPKVAFDAAARRLTLSMDAHASSVVGGPKTWVQVEVRDASTNQLIAEDDVVLQRGGQVAKVYSTAASNGRPVRMRLKVDGWPSGYVYDIDTARSDSGVASAAAKPRVAIVDPARELVIRSKTGQIDAHVAVDLSDRWFRYGQDEIAVGLDLNHDRYLRDEPTVSSKHPVSIQFAWAGVNEQGQLGISNRVGHVQLHLPVRGQARNQRTQLIAQLRRGAEITWSQPVTVVFDDEPPVIEDVQITSAIPASLAGPLQIRVSVDDAGLSGAAVVRAGWATLGQTEFTPEVTAMEAQRMQDDRWAVDVPVDGLVPGVHTLLVQATDRAGNVGKTKSLAVQLYSAEQLAELKSQQTTAVHGKVAYVKRPLKGITVKLRKVIPPNEESEGDADPPAANTALETVSDEVAHQATTAVDGSFWIKDVRAGDYELQVEGLYRGMRQRKTIKIAVKPPQPASVDTIRVD